MSKSSVTVVLRGFSLLNILFLLCITLTNLLVKDLYREVRINVKLLIFGNYNSGCDFIKKKFYAFAINVLDGFTRLVYKVILYIFHLDFKCQKFNTHLYLSQYFYYPQKIFPNLSIFNSYKLLKSHGHIA